MTPSIINFNQVKLIIYTYLTNIMLHTYYLVLKTGFEDAFLWIFTVINYLHLTEVSWNFLHKVKNKWLKLCYVETFLMTSSYLYPFFCVKHFLSDEIFGCVRLYVSPWRYNGVMTWIFLFSSFYVFTCYFWRIRVSSVK